MHYKKSQVTIFILIGIVISIILIIFIYQKTYETKIPKVNYYDLDTNKVQFFIQKCVDETAKNSVIYVSKEGAYYDNLELSIFYPSYIGERIPIWVIPGTVNIPNYTTLKNSLVDYVKDNLESCVSVGLSKFSNEGYNIETGEIEADVIIKETSVIFNLNYPIKIKKGDKTSEISKFSSIINVELSKMFNIATEIAKSQIEDPTWLPISLITEIAIDENINFEIELFEEGVIIHLIKENSSLLEPYEFSFAVGYNETMLKERE
ncbi:MAG: hypothetical protein QXG86_02050 [Candidatus Woesearchaeota archaeon]